MLVVQNQQTAPLLLLGAAGLLMLSACAQDPLPISTPMRLGQAAFAPRGYLKFCERRPDQCGLQTPMGEVERAGLEKTLMQEQWANVLHLQPTATAEHAPAGPAIGTVAAEPPVPVEAPVDLTGLIDLGGAPLDQPPPERAPTSFGDGVESRPVSYEAETVAAALDRSLKSLTADAASLAQSPPATLGFTLLTSQIRQPSRLLQIENAPESGSSSGLGSAGRVAPVLTDTRLVDAYDRLSPAAAPLSAAPVDTPIRAINPLAVLSDHAAVAPIHNPVILHATPLVWQALNGVNQSVNARIRPMDDEQAFGVADYWTLPLSDGPRAVGNCKHYVLEKRKALVDAGFSPDALSIAIVKTSWGEVHAVLIVATDQGDYVLDNLTSVIKAWADVRYTWIERQTPGKPLRWASVLTGDQAAQS